ncbi:MULTISPECIES: glycosyltransferase [unclassified Marinobacterium]|uniref:glycosyltransferase n=1 Tax=unclassified Marinobacterium TaxID=2644139 RepID=UPI0015686158|nr:MULTISPECIES: glycosyltransferase [unclassified Marinobacterium]NRP09210.1 UDP-Gal:alpha-D-GlcNAc-diphosphoundecaprenol beta-1,3-galactosyltransferase [Marinobacterium sp. xm-g-48]NRP82259.1 UDP-Gal:alpha-D-GlcNAc-diphosphoundecaprenol beta-1,3-galactosyltransferase [Marinobacterium sp. xm-d-509]
MNKISVVMSVYKNDKLEWLRESVDSILNQTYENFDLFIAVDGPVSDTLMEYVEGLSIKENVNVFYFEECCGLAARLNFLIKKVLLDPDVRFIARMDADDISMPDRLQKQLNYILQNELDVIGSSVVEFCLETGVRHSKKSVIYDDDLKKNIVVRCPFNHPTVLFRREVFDSGIKYDESLKNTQDYKLWVDMAFQGMLFGNVAEPLLQFRISKDFHKRRGFKKAKNDFYLRFYAMRKLRLYSFRNLLAAFSILVLRISPEAVTKFAYKYLR